jgi:uncharacterized protein YgbK (DUF1537 family)
MLRKKRLVQEAVRVIVLDDDPTGIQTVHGCLVLTDWRFPTLQAAFEDDEPYFYIFTNTRAFPPETARGLVRDAVRRIGEVNRRYRFRLVFICRSDSTLRSHFPLEMDAVALETGLVPDARFLVPAFFEGGRITCDDTHFLVRGDQKIPCHETEFARDPVFGYTTAYLPGYIEEKTNSQVCHQDVYSISRDLLLPNRRADLLQLLNRIAPNRYVVVNAGTYSELDRFSDIIVDRIVDNAAYLFQSAASFVKSLVGCPDKDFVGADATTIRGPGLVIVGSHVQKASRQLDVLLQEPCLVGIELNAETALDHNGSMVAELGRKVSEAMKNGRHPVVYTSRKKISRASKTEQLRAGRRISDRLSQLVADLKIPPAFLIAKGGITAHDILVKGLEIRYARVLGQAASGVPVIRMPGGHRWPGMPFVIFPGNVGGDGDLKYVFRSLSGSTDE